MFENTEKSIENNHSKSAMTIFSILMVIIFLLSGCSKNSANDITEEMDGFTHLSPNDAVEFVKSAASEDALIVDVRGEIAYAQGHIPGAIATWHEDYYEGRIDELPDLDQKILVYCDFGDLSKKVAKKLVEQGYTNVYEFNGMEVWTGDVEMDEEYEGLEELN